MSKIIAVLISISSVIYSLYLYWNKDNYQDGPWWVLLILVFVVIAVLLYMVFGSKKPVSAT